MENKSSLFEDPGDAVKDPIWQFFLKSKLRNNSTRRYMAKCTFCDEVFDGKILLMKKHGLNCKMIKSDVKAQIVLTMIADKYETVSLDTTSKRSSSKCDKSITSFFSPAKLSERNKDELAMALIRAFIAGQVPFRVMDGFYFQEFVRMLKPQWSIPSRKTLMDNHLVRLYAAALGNKDRTLASEDYFTLMLDGWSDVSNNSIYGVMLLHGHTNSDVLDILDLSSNQHTAVNILTEVEVCVNQSCVKWSAIKCCVTDSPSTMTKFRRILHEKRPHIVMLPCALHVFNILAKDVCRYIHAKCIVKTNCLLVNFFTSSHVRFHKSKEWIRNNTNIIEKHTLETLCETRWNMTKVCLGVATYEQFFFESLQKQGKVDGYPAVKKNITDLIS